MRDVIIIGAGPGGMTAALYAKRANLDVMIIEQGLPGGQMNNTDVVENYPGFVSIKGRELSQKMYENIEANDIEKVTDIVTNVYQEDDVNYIVTTKEIYSAKVVIIATGAKHRVLNVDGEEEYSGRGVSYCAICDGPFFKNKHVVVIGGGDAAVEESLYLAQLASKVTIVHRRDQLRAYKHLQDKVFANPKIEIIWDTVVDKIEGNQIKFTGIKAHNVKTNEKINIEADGIFIYVGMEPNTNPFTKLDIMDDKGWIITNEQMETSKKGIFAIGDVRKKNLRQITTAVAEGTIAGQNAFNYIENL